MKNIYNNLFIQKKTIFYSIIVITIVFLFIIINFLKPLSYISLSFITSILFLITIIQLPICSKYQYHIQNLKLSNKTYIDLYDSTRTFEHDFRNILQAIGGYIYTNDINGLQKYYNDISNDYNNLSNLQKLNSKNINNPAIYNILASKYYITLNNNITFNLDINLDLNTINMRIYEFTKILGILLDNAIEATSECTEKSINLSFSQNKHKQIMHIENTYINKNISIDKIFEKNFSTKPNNSGLGLWEIRKILLHNSNINLHTTKNDTYFSQTLEIYNKKT